MKTVRRNVKPLTGNGDRPVPFFENDADNNHCSQASMMMALQYLGKGLTRSRIDELSGYERDKYTWLVQCAVILASYVSGTKLMTQWDYASVSERGIDYLNEVWGAAWVKLQVQHGSAGLAKERAVAGQAVAMGLCTKPAETLEEFESLLGDNLIIAMIAPAAFDPTAGLTSHIILIFGQDDGYFIAHDPGLPPRRNWTVPKQSLFAEVKGREYITVPRVDSGVSGNE